MIDISLFGRLIGTLASKLSVVLLLVALASLTILAATGIEASERLGPRRASAGGALPVDRVTRAVGLAVSAGALLLALLGLRVGAGEVDLVPTLALGLAGSMSLGASLACGWSFASRWGAALALEQSRRGARAELVDQRRGRALEAQRRAYLQGLDLRTEVAAADAGVGRLRAAVVGLAEARGALQAKLSEASAPAGDDAPRTTLPGGTPIGDDAEALVDELTRARDELTLKMELGQRVLVAAEAAALRLACNEPLRRLLRRRPAAATRALSAGAGDGRALQAAIASIEAFLAEVRAAGDEIGEIERDRATLLGEDAEGGAPARARRELAAMEAAYGALLGRLRVAAVRMSAQSGMAEVERAAGALSGAARAAELDPAEVDALVTEVARAEAALSVAAPEGGVTRGLPEALAAGSAALDRSDAASLWDLITALREVR